MALTAILWSLAYGLMLIYLIILYFSKIVNFLRSRSNLKNSDADNIAFSLQKNVSSGNYQTVYGIFNKRTNEILDAEKSESERIDSDVAAIHALKELAVYS